MQIFGPDSKTFSVGFVSFSVELRHLVAMLCHIVANATFSGNI